MNPAIEKTLDGLEELSILKEIVSINALLNKNGYKGRILYTTETLCNMYVYKTKEDALKIKGLDKLEPQFWSNCDAPAHAYFDGHEVENADIIVKYDNELDWSVEVK
jgi:hypothetical protein